MEVNINDMQYSVLLHDLSHIAEYLKQTERQSVINNEMYHKRLLNIRQELIEAIDTKD